jgi:tetratricopeptide (TPR) repeat protein
MGACGESVARLRDALRHDPQQVETRLMLANFLERSGELEAAKSELQRVLDSRPDQWLAAYRLGQAGELVVAGQLFREAARIAPGNAAPQLALATALKEIGEIEQALLVLREAQKLPSAQSSAAMMIADCQVQLGQPEEALQSLRQALYRSRQPGVVHQRLGDVLMSLEKFPEAIEEYRAAVLRRPELRERQPKTAPLDRSGGVRAI